MTQGVCPSSTGAKDVIPPAFSPPRTGLLYIPAHNTCMDHRASKRTFRRWHAPTLARTKMYAGPGGYQGELVGDVVQKRKVGVKDEKFWCTAACLQDGLATSSSTARWTDGSRYSDARSGAELWKFHTSSAIIGNPITYLGPTTASKHVAVYSGIGGWAPVYPDVSADDPYAALERSAP